MTPSLSSRMPRRTLGLGMALALVGASVGIAGAAIPQNGVYTGCYNKNTGALRVIDAAVASQKCASNEKQITWSQTGPAGADGTDGTDGSDGTDGANGTDGISQSFWSGRDTRGFAIGLAGVQGRVADTGPIPPAWWTVTGQLTIDVTADVRLQCVLMATAPGQAFGGLVLANLFQDDVNLFSTTIPIRMLIDQSTASGDTIANIQCLTSPTVFPGSLGLSADLLVIPTEHGQLGVAP